MLTGSAAADTKHYVTFTSGATTIGRIEQNGTSNVAYVTSSDRRLKTIVGPIADAVDRVKALKPYRVTWNGDAARGETDAFIADEVAGVVPDAVSGEPDAVDDDGNPEFQGLEYGALVTVLTAALQDALTRIEALEAAATP